MTDLFGRQTIDSFSGDYAFLSNFYPTYVMYEGRLWPTVEHAYQAMKCANPSDVALFWEPMTPGQAKRLARKVPRREDWDAVKDRIMLEATTAKFKDARMAELLLATGDAILIEGNTWGDTYWGVCDGKGENRLGLILMHVRDNLRKKMINVPRDFITHKGSWRNALEFAYESAKDVDPDEAAYWAHEIRAFDRAYAELEEQL